MGCGIGVLDFLLVYDCAQRKVVGWDEDSTYVEIAQNTFTVNRFPVEFVKKIPDDLTEFNFIITSSEKESERLGKLVNLEEWELGFHQGDLKVFKKKDARRI